MRKLLISIIICIVTLFGCTQKKTVALDKETEPVTHETLYCEEKYAIEDVCTDTLITVEENDSIKENYKQYWREIIKRDSLRTWVDDDSRLPSWPKEKTYNLPDKIIRTFLQESKDKTEKVKYKNTLVPDTMFLYNGANAIVLIDYNKDIPNDTIQISRSFLNNKLRLIEIEYLEIINIYFEGEKGDTLLFNISLCQPDTDLGYSLMFKHTKTRDFLEIIPEIWDED